MNSMTLYSMTDEYRQLLDMAADPDADQESFDAALQSIHGEITKKAIAVASVARNLEALAAQIDAAVKDMTARSRQAKARADCIKEYLLGNMQAAGIKKVESPYFVVAIKKNPESVDVDEDADIQPRFCVVIPASIRPDKTAIKNALKAGEVVDGCRLVQKERLDIK